MGGTVDLRRFSLLVFLFVVSMFFLVFSGNFFITIVGWDGLGLVSFCLVIFYMNSSRLESGLVTVFRNRIGDAFFLICFFIFSLGGWWNFDFLSYNVLFLFLVFLFFGAITKRAQIPFSAWLPAAIAAPTPVSSLVHSSTLVTAGIYVLIRYSYLFSFLDLSFFKIFSLFTIILAGGCANFEKDFKKVVAMSTLRQLGLILFVICVGSWILSFIHIVIHAFFKSMLFLATGSLIGQVAGGQDSRFYGSTIISYYSFVYFLVSCFCLRGFPFFIGFYSKDFIIVKTSFIRGFSLYYLFLVGCIFTVMYRIRLVVFRFTSLFKCFNYVSFLESFFFFVPVRFLFFKCWLVRGFFYWFFLVEFFFVLEVFDLLVGIFLMIAGVLVFFFIKFFYFFSVYFSKMSFLQWSRARGSSFTFKKFHFSFYDFNWIELFGGLGFYKYISGFSFFLSMLGKFGLGRILVLRFRYLFLFF